MEPAAVPAGAEEEELLVLRLIRVYLVEKKKRERERRK